ncbi:AAA family ATPase [Anaerovorax odorimutans]|uniref:AAA family ATPase n=1 Tax=Anaerovorax odorimutans TaxID=109327 RepID=A0ABT1RP48_9FIRM|nr:AAA family ATPase [Anaerovorax odorimutans]MCQ4636945.1 AAA family ATPase [Anaerovorax odorimutans]
MGKIEGLRIQNFGPLRDIVMGKTLSNQNAETLNNITAIIGASGNGKSTLSDVFGFIADCLELGVEAACDEKNRGGFHQIRSQGVDEPIAFELYYRETSRTHPIIYELHIDEDPMGRPYVKAERLRERVEGQGRLLSFFYLQNGKGYAFEGTEGGADEEGRSVKGKKVEMELADVRKLGIVTLGAMKQYERIEGFLNFLKSWYLCYFSPDEARKIQTAAPQPYLNRTGSNLNNVAQYMYRENKKEFEKVLREIQTKLPGIEKIEPVRFDNGQMMLKFWETGFKEAFYSPKMSDGTLKLFAYYLLLHESNPRQLVFIEEPENGLYHQYLNLLADEMIQSVGSGFSKQLFVTTHSPFFVNALSPTDVWVLTKGEDGFAMIKRATEYQFVEALSEEGVPLGDMWYNKYFG